MRRRWQAPIALATAAALLAACGGDDDDDVATPLPAVELVALSDGTPVNLADIEGPAVLNLWATWCGPCRREIPDFEEVHQDRGGEVDFIGINIGEDADAASAFLAEVGATYPQYLDSDGYALTELNAAALPVTIVVDGDGNIFTRHLGPMDTDDLTAAIDRVVR